MAKKDTSNDHGDSSAPAGIDSPGTFGPINRKPTDPDDGLPQKPADCGTETFPGGFSYPQKGRR